MPQARPCPYCETEVVEAPKGQPNAMLLHYKTCEKKPKIPPLSKEAQEARQPLPVDVLLGALQDPIHRSSEKVVKVVPLPKKIR